MKLPKFLREQMAARSQAKRKHDLPPGVTRNATCCRNECEKPAVWSPTIEIHPVGETFKPGRYATAATTLTVCDEHKDDNEIRLMFNPEHNPEGARQIRVMFHAQGKAEPDLVDTRVSWVRI